MSVKENSKLTKKQELSVEEMEKITGGFYIQSDLDNISINLPLYGIKPVTPNLPILKYGIFPVNPPIRLYYGIMPPKL